MEKIRSRPQTIKAALTDNGLLTSRLLSPEYLSRTADNNLRSAIITQKKGENVIREKAVV